MGIRIFWLQLIPFQNGSNYGLWKLKILAKFGMCCLVNWSVVLDYLLSLDVTEGVSFLVCLVSNVRNMEWKCPEYRSKTLRPTVRQKGMWELLSSQLNQLWLTMIGIRISGRCVSLLVWLDLDFFIRESLGSLHLLFVLGLSPDYQ